MKWRGNKGFRVAHSEWKVLQYTFQLRKNNRSLKIRPCGEGPRAEKRVFRRYHVTNNPINRIDPMGLQEKCKQDQCNRTWDQCYTNCINTLAPINPWTVFTNVTLYGNALYYLGGGTTTISIAGKTIVLVESPLVLAPALVAASEVLYVAGGVYLSWVAGSSIGCMISCSINPCNY